MTANNGYFQLLQMLEVRIYNYSHGYFKPMIISFYITYKEHLLISSYIYASFCLLLRIVALYYVYKDTERTTLGYLSDFNTIFSILSLALFSIPIHHHAWLIHVRIYNIPSFQTTDCIFKCPKEPHRTFL